MRIRGERNKTVSAKFRFLVAGGAVRGSSVHQGSGAVHLGQKYEAILGRELSLDCVNLGFGGTVKAESSVVALVDSIPVSATTCLTSANPTGRRL